MGKKEHCKEELKMIILNGKQGKQIIVDGSTVKIIKKGGIFASEREKNVTNPEHFFCRS